jgi:putative transposase
VYVAIFIDAIVVKVREGQVANRPVYAVIGVTLEGRKDVLGLTMGTGGGEGAKFWMSVLVGLKNRGVRDVFFLVCDGLKGLPEVVDNVWPHTIVQTCMGCAPEGSEAHIHSTHPGRRGHRAGRTRREMG